MRNTGTLNRSLLTLVAVYLILISNWKLWLILPQHPPGSRVRCPQSFVLQDAALPELKITCIDSCFSCCSGSQLLLTIVLSPVSICLLVLRVCSHRAVDKLVMQCDMRVERCLLSQPPASHDALRFRSPVRTWNSLGPNDHHPR